MDKNVAISVLTVCVAEVLEKHYPKEYKFILKEIADKFDVEIKKQMELLKQKYG